MAKCIDCAFLTQDTHKSNHICSIEKMRNPGAPGLYVKNPNSPACNRNFRSKSVTENNKN